VMWCPIFFPFPHRTTLQAEVLHILPIKRACNSFSTHLALGLLSQSTAWSRQGDSTPTNIPLTLQQIGLFLEADSGRLLKRPWL
jgi:hypothetical protein